MDTSATGHEDRTAKRFEALRLAQEIAEAQERLRDLTKELDDLLGIELTSGHAADAMTYGLRANESEPGPGTVGGRILAALKKKRGQTSKEVAGVVFRAHAKERLTQVRVEINRLKESGLVRKTAGSKGHRQVRWEVA